MERLEVIEAAAGKCSVNTVFLKVSQASQENTCIRVSFFRLSVCNLIKKETPVQVFSFELGKIYLLKKFIK